MTHILLAIIYISFISLGLPDSLLGSAWPILYKDLQVPVSYAGILSMIIAAGTIVSSLFSSRLIWHLGTGKITAISVAMTALALLGFSLSPSFALLCLWAIPYGLGAGSVDAALNNFVALYFSSRHMSWLHCMWGVGASLGPFIMGQALAGGFGWTGGYRFISLLHAVLTALLLLSLPVWKYRPGAFSERKKEMEAKSQSQDTRGEASLSQDTGAHSSEIQNSQPQEGSAPLSFSQVFALPKVKTAVICFFCYCALEQTTGLWAGTYLTLTRGVAPETAASWASLFYIGITAGRGASGFVTMALSDRKMIRLGQAVIICGILALLLPLGPRAAMLGLVLIGLGCAPIYPCIIHSTPALFGAWASQAVIGLEMACAYVGTCLMPPFFGWLAEHLFSTGLFPYYLALFLILMLLCSEHLWRGAASRSPSDVQGASDKFL